MMDDVFVTKMGVTCSVGGVSIYSEDFPDGSDYSAGTPYGNTITWFIPAFAPSGGYIATLKIYGQLGGGAEEVIGCLTASFSL